MSTLPFVSPLRRRLRRFVPWVLAGVFLLLALFSTVGRILTSQLEGNEATLAGLVADATGLDVVIGRAEGRFLAWHPVLELESLEMAPAGAAPAIRIGRMRVEVDVGESLLRGRFIAASLVVEDLVVDLALGADRRWRLRDGRDRAPPAPATIIEFLYHSDHVDLRRAVARLWSLDPDAEPLQVELDGGLLNRRGLHRGHLALRIPALEAPRPDWQSGPDDGRAEVATGVLYLSLGGNPLDARTRAGELLLDLDDVPLETITGRLRGGDPAARGMVDRLRLRARFDPLRGVDATLRAASRRIDAGSVDPLRVRNIRLQADGFGLGRERGDLRFAELRGNVGGEALVLDGLEVAWRSASAAHDGEASLDSRVAPGRAAARAGTASPGSGVTAVAGTAPVERPARQWYAKLAGFDAEAMVELLLTLDMFGSRTSRWLVNLDPRAEVINARLHVDERSGQLAAAVRLRDLNLRGYRGVPTIRGAEVDAVVHERGGWVDLDSGPFYLRFPDVFDEGWRYDRGRGRINFAFEGSTLNLLSDRVEIEGPMGRANARIGLYLPEAAADRRVALMLGVEAADAAYTEAYLPEKLSPGLRSWLVGAVRAGRVEQGAVLIHGQLLPTEPRARSTALWFDVRDARIAFDARWPTATSVTGRIVAGIDGVRAELASARLAGIDAGATRLRVTLDDSRLGALQIRGEGTAEADALLAFLREAPLGDAVRFLDDPWEATGHVGLAWDLEVPLDGGVPERVRVDTSLQLASLWVPPGSVRLDDVSGRLDYVYPGTLSADDLQATLFGGRARATLSGSLADGEPGLRFDVAGRAEGHALAQWLDIDAMSRLRGEADYAAVLDLLPGGVARLRVESDAGDLETGLPVPLVAPEGALSVEMHASPETPVDIRIDWERFSGQFLLDDRALQRGVMAVGAPLGELPALGLAAAGRVDAFDVGQWLAALDRIEEDAIVRGRRESSARTTLVELDLDVGAASWGNTQFGAANLNLTGSTRAFELAFDAERIDGTLRVRPDDAPLELEIGRLELPLDSTADPLPPSVDGEPAADAQPSLVHQLTADLNTAEMPDIDVIIRRFSLEEEDLGRAAFKLRPDLDGLRLTEIDAEGRGLVFSPDGEGRAEVDLRLVPVPVTRVAGRLSGTDAENILERWSLAPTVEAEAFAFDVELDWPGPLDQPDLQAMTGRIQVDAQRGRFVQIDAGTGPLRVVGLFNFAALARRIRFDFTDLYRRGIAFEDIDGVLTIEDGLLRADETLRIVGPSSSFAITGEMNLVTQELDGELIVTLPVSSNLPWYAASAALVNPLAGAGVWVAERIFRDQIERYSSARYRISGDVEQPAVELDTVFENRTTPEADEDVDQQAGEDAAESAIDAPPTPDAEEPQP